MIRARFHVEKDVSNSQVLLGTKNFAVTRVPFMKMIYIFYNRPWHFPQHLPALIWKLMNAPHQI